MGWYSGRMSLLSNIKEGVKNLLYEKPITPTSGRAEKTWVTQTKQAIGSASVAIPLTKATELPGVVAKVVTASKGAVGAVASSVGNVVKANPIKSAVGGLVGAGYVANTGVKQSASDIAKGGGALVNFGGNLGEIRKNPTWSNVLTTAKENPVISAGVVGLAGYGLTKGGLYAYDTLKDKTTDTFTGGMSKLEDNPEYKKWASDMVALGEKEGTKSKDTTPQSLPETGMSPNNSPIPAGASYPADNTGVGYMTDKPQKKYTPRKKTKDLNNRPINIRNNIMIANKNG